MSIININRRIKEKIMISNNDNYLNDLKRIISAIRAYIYRAVNQMQIISNWLVGWRLVEQEQQGKQRADYGKYVLETASKVLTEEFGKGYSISALKGYSEFYIEFRDIEIRNYLPSDLDNAIYQIGQALLAQFKNRQKQQTLPAEFVAHKGQESKSLYIFVG